MGIPVDSLSVLGQLHCTSKIASLDDLMPDIGGGDNPGLATMGFRGEALHLLTQVADVSIITRTSADVVASRVVFSAGQHSSLRLEPIAAPVGTLVKVTNLFDRLPVRAKLHSEHIANEFRLVQRYLFSLCLLHPTIRVACDRPSVLRPAHACVSHSIPSLFGSDIATHLRPFFTQVRMDDPIEHGAGVMTWSCAGWWPHPCAPVALVSRNKQCDRTFTYVNGRLFHDEHINRFDLLCMVIFSMVTCCTSIRVFLLLQFSL